MGQYYIASCMFTAQFPEISLRVQEYIQTHPEIQIVRCCIPNYRVAKNTVRIPEGPVRDAWERLPVSHVFQPSDEVISVCLNCTNIVEEWRKGVKAISLWEFMDRDGSFRFPDHSGLKATLQDCWRTRDRRGEQEAVRSLLWKMQVNFLETEANFEKAVFCGSTLYREQPRKNSVLAPKHYVEQAQGFFRNHTKEEQAAIMRAHCSQYQTHTVLCYCHYCLEGLRQGGVNGIHLAELLFGKG